MKKIVLMALALVVSFTAMAQKQGKEIADRYRRNSLCLMMLDDAAAMADVDVANHTIIREAFVSAPMPDKYNDHNVGERLFSVSTVSEDMPGQISQHLLEAHVAKQLYDKWFVADDGSFTMDLIHERGLYDATEMDWQTAKNSIRGEHMLRDAGEELINNTFVVVSRYRYMSKEELVAEIQALTAVVGNVADELGAGGWGAIAAMAANAAIEMSIGEGYYVRTTSYLFQLNWNDEISARLFGELLSNPQKYHASDIFSLKYIGEERAWANTKAGVFAKSKKSDAELVGIATINATDAVLAKLERTYDPFKTKTPILSIEKKGITASIGMKEGLEPGDKYEILEKRVDPETGRTTYTRKGTVKVSNKKGQIWDNRYGVSEELTQADSLPKFSVFTGKTKGLYPGMLLRQIK